MFSVKMESQQKKRRRIACATLHRILFQFLCQSDTDLYTVDKAGAFVVTAEGADWIDNLIHLPERHAIHQLIQFMEILLDLVIIHQVDFIVGFVEHSEDGLG